MAREFAKKFYASSVWKKNRELYIISVNGICERCNHRAGKIVHHKKYLTPQNLNDTDISLNFNNLELLCQDCHNDEHMGNATLTKGLKFDTFGNVIQK